MPFLSQGPASGAAIRVHLVGLQRRRSLAFGRGGVVKLSLRVLTHVSERLRGEPYGGHVQIFEASFFEVVPDDGDLCGVVPGDFFKPVRTFDRETR